MSREDGRLVVYPLTHPLAQSQLVPQALKHVELSVDFGHCPQNMPRLDGI